MPGTALEQYFVSFILKRPITFKEEGFENILLLIELLKIVYYLTAVLALGPERPQNGPPLLKVITKLAGLRPRATRGRGKPFWPSGRMGLRNAHRY